VIADAVDRIQAIEQRLTEKTDVQLQARLTIRACLKELRDISRQPQAVTSCPDGELQPAN
jgi:hypothetical protein